MNLQQLSTTASNQIGINSQKMRSRNSLLHYLLSAFSELLWKTTKKEDWTLRKEYKGDRYTHLVYSNDAGDIKHVKHYWNRSKPLITIIKHTHGK